MVLPKVSLLSVNYVFIGIIHIFFHPVSAQDFNICEIAERYWSRADTGCNTDIVCINIYYILSNNILKTCFMSLTLFCDIWLIFLNFYYF